MDDGWGQYWAYIVEDDNSAEELVRQYNIKHIDCVRTELTRLRDDRKADKELFVRLTQCIGSLAGLKE